MITYTENSNLGKAIKVEKSKVEDKYIFENNIQKKLKNYIKTLSAKGNDETSYGVMLLNNIKNTLMQTENNMQDIDSLTDMLDILENQDEITDVEIEAYNKSAQKVNDEIEFVNNFLQKTTDFFGQENFMNDKSVTNIVKKIKTDLLSGASEIIGSAETAPAVVTPEPIKREIKKNIDCAASDFSCFIPKNKNDHLVIATTQPSYKIMFEGNVATIAIEEENFRIKLNTCGVQVSNSVADNVLFVVHQDSKYTIITNNQLELSRTVQVYQISKNGDFLEVDIGGQDLRLAVKDNVVSFEDADQNETVIYPENHTEKNSQIYSQFDIGESNIPSMQTPIDTGYAVAAENNHSKTNKEYNVAVKSPAFTKVETDVEQEAKPQASPQVETKKEVNASVPVMPQVNISSGIDSGSVGNIEANTPVLTQVEAVSNIAVQIPATAPTGTIDNVEANAPVLPQVEAVSTADVQAPVLPQVETTEKIEIHSPVFSQGNAEKKEEVAAPAPVASKVISPDELVDNDTLTISDSNKMVILPYKAADVKKKYEKNKKKYSSVSDVIAKEYTIPVATFKNPVKSRFREAFQLIKKKEHGSLKDAVSLGMELMFQSDLNPAVIAACKNLDELDIYLDCLDDNELDKFSCFKIKYEVPPAGKH